jgi:Asp-tRNA(Asn)/Glu-tRNA(Gln) amidotransferase A subunit family amidase
MNPYTYFQFTIPANFSGLPSLSFPCGISNEGLPHTMQLVGNHFSEPTLCRIGHTYQQATDWHKIHPDI